MVALFAVLILAGSSANAQKFGYVDLQELMQLMPEYKKANTDMEAFGKSLEDELKKLSDEFQKKVADYQKVEKTLNEAIRDLKQKELQDMQSRIQEFQQAAQENIRKKEADLLKPIVDKAKNAIAQVAKEVGYTYVFDANSAGMLYKPEGDNITPAVKKKLGLVDAPIAPPRQVAPQK
jgi:outer membrane protein